MRCVEPRYGPARCPGCGTAVWVDQAECTECGRVLQAPSKRLAGSTGETRAGGAPIGSFAVLIASIIALIFSLQKLHEYGTGLGQFAVAVSEDAANEKTVCQLLAAAAVVGGVISLGLILSYYARSQSAVTHREPERAPEAWRPMSGEQARAVEEGEPEPEPAAGARTGGQPAARGQGEKETGHGRSRRRRTW